jgi:hypothetical protein
MTGLIGRLNRTRRRSYPLKRFQRRNPRAIAIVDTEQSRDLGFVVVREYRRDPNWTKWTFTTPLKAANDLDTVELLGRDNDDPVMSDPS